MSEVYWPKKVELREAGISALSAFISGIVGSAIIFVWVFFFWAVSELPISITWKTDSEEVTTISAMIPIMVSLMAWVALMFTIYMNYLFLANTCPDRYKKTWIHLAQIAILMILMYIILTPLYLLIWGQGPEHILWMYIAHIFVALFWTTILLEVLNNYRYVLVAIYSAIISIVITAWITVWLFTAIWGWTIKVLLLVLFLPICNAMMFFIKDLLLIAYYNYFNATWLDPIWDIFHQIEQDEQEDLRTNIESNF